jgi:hypothetical protein
VIYQRNKNNADNNCYLGSLDIHDNEKEEEYDEIAEDGKYYREKTEVALNGTRGNLKLCPL